MRQVCVKTTPVLGPILVGAVSIAIAAIVMMASALPRFQTSMSRPPGARRSADEAAKRFLALGSAYQQPCALIVAPSYRNRDLPLVSPAGFHRRHVWQGAIAVNGQILDLVMNDNTGNLMCVFDAGKARGRAEPAAVTVPIVSPAQAARVSVQAARRFQMIPDGAETALKETPTRSRFSDRWHVSWWVRDSRKATPHLLTIVLRGVDGRLDAAANGRELADYVAD